MMQSTEHSFAAHSMVLRKLVSMLNLGRRRKKRGGDTWAQAHVDPSVIVMEDPPIENVLEMSLSHRDQEIQTLPANRSD